MRLRRIWLQTVKTRCTGVVRRMNRETEKKMLISLECLLARYGIVLRDDKGQGLIEYVLIAAIIGIAALVGMGVVGGQLDTSFTNLAGDVAIP